MANDSPRRLRKSQRERVFFGVAGGLAEYLEVDATIVRVVFAVLCFVGGLGIIAYIALALFMPEAARDIEGADSEERLGGSSVNEAGARPEASAQRARNIVGIILIGIGVIFLFQQVGLSRWLDWGTFWAIIIILIGVALVAGRLRR